VVEHAQNQQLAHLAAPPSDFPAAMEHLRTAGAHKAESGTRSAIDTKGIAAWQPH
jgi:hypothetical protein